MFWSIVPLGEDRITGAFSPNTPSLGDWLVRRGTLSEPELRRALGFQKDDDPKNLLGATLIKHQILEPAVVREALRGVIGDTVRDLMGWVNGQFTFDPEAAIEPGPSDIAIEIDPQGVLLDIFKELDESNRP